MSKDLESLFDEEVKEFGEVAEGEEKGEGEGKGGDLFPSSKEGERAKGGFEDSGASELFGEEEVEKESGEESFAGFEPSPPSPQPPSEAPVEEEGVTVEEAFIGSGAGKVEERAVREVEFDFEEDKGTTKTVFMVYGLKGHGKTTFAFSFPGTIACLSFDRKAKRVKDAVFRGADRIKVYDAVRYMVYDTGDELLESSELTFRYVLALLDHLRDVVKPDWVVIDGSEILQRICEYVMRYRNNLTAFQGVQLSLWKERRMYIKQVHDRAFNAAGKGVIYTAYVDNREIVRDGDLVLKEEVPKWIDAIEYETDVVIRVEARKGKDGKYHFYARVDSSKDPRIPTGVVKDVTGKGLSAFLSK